MSPKKRFVLFVACASLLSIAWAAPSQAQGFRGRRVVQPVFIGGYYADPFFFGAYPPYPYGYQFGYPYPFYARDRGASVRIEVTPAEAEVYVDGYYAGIVDDFDGYFQRLHAAPGEHEIALYREGYRTVRQKVYLSPDATFKIRYTMERLAAGELSEARPVPTERTAQQGQPPFPQGQPPYPQGPPQFPPRGPVGRGMPMPPNMPPQNQPPPGNPRPGETSAYGTLSIRVQPGGAAVVIDGEQWQGPQGQERLLVQVPEGPHRVQVLKDGYEPFATDIQVHRRETTPLNISLSARP